MSEARQAELAAGKQLFLDVIKSRRSYGRVKSDPIPKETLQSLLEAAISAPSHYNTQPWRFIVMTGEGRKKLGEGYAKVAQAEDSAIDAEKLERSRKQALRAPAVIAVVCSPGDDKRAMKIEEQAASHAAVQNILLAANAHGLGAIWRSGAPMYHPVMKEHFGLGADEELVAFVYIGIPDMTPPEAKRKSVSECTTWIDK